MAEPKENLQMEKIVSLCKRRGFVFQSSEIYGGLNGFWDYGPLGAELKRNVKELWWQAMTRQRDDVAGLEATIIMSPKIWEASGHVDTFSDPMCDCLLTKKRFRADQIEPQSGTVYHFSGAYDGSKFNPLLNQYPEAMRDAVEKIIRTQVLASWEGIFTDYAASQESGETKILKEKSENLEHERQQRILAFQKEYQVTGCPTYEELFDSLIGASDCRDSYSVLLPPGKPPESARKIAIQFYQQRGVNIPNLVGERTEKVENSTRFNPENGSLLTEPRPFNLMFKTFVGPVDILPPDLEMAGNLERRKAWLKAFDESQKNVAYLRPETAQAIFAQFKNVLETSRQKVPFGIAQVGKAFRNEVTPRNFTFRSREFEQMELEFFIKPDEVIEAIHGEVFKCSVSSVQPELAELKTENLKLETPQPNWGWQAWHQYWVEERVRFYEGIGLSRETLGFHRQTPVELAHYARACTDILFKFPFSKKDADGNVTGDELEGIAARSDFDLSQHQRFSGKPMGVFDDELRAAWAKLPKERQDDLWKRYYDNRKNYLTKSAKPDETPEQISKQATEDANGLAKGQYIPHVIEPSAGVDRLILALIANAYSEVTETDDKGKSETRVTMKFHPRVAPIKVGVFPLLKNKPELVAKAREVYELLRPHLKAFYDDGGAIGRRYARQDEAGTPFCVTIDFDTLGEKPELLDTVTVRHRDDGRQERLKISELLAFLLLKIR
jgi:glycyl-tRNA synthetase